MKTVTKFLCDICEGAYEDQKSAEICETKHKIKQEIFFLVDLAFAQREPNPVNVFTFSSLEEMSLFKQKSLAFSGPGKYVYVNATGSFIPLEYFLTQKREELNRFNKLAKNQLNKLTQLLERK